MDQCGFGADKAVLIGESGGDGPHFEWEAKMGAFLIGSMTKPLFYHYCSQRGIKINHHFGHRYSKGKKTKEMQVNFMDLITINAAIL